MLQQPVDSWPPWKPTQDHDTIEIGGSESKRVPIRFDTVLLTTIADGGEELELIHRWSTYQKTCRITSYVLRFCHLTYKRLATRPKPRVPQSYWLEKYTECKWKSEAFGTITHENEQSRIRPSLFETRIAFKYWAMLSQRTSFPEEITAVTKGETVDRKSATYMLTPQIDADRLLRICGRLGNTNLPYDVKHPIILSRTSILAKLLAEEAHQLLCHGGVQLCTQLLRNKVWIIGVRILLRTVVQQCVICTRYRQHSEQQFMADIPARRLDAAPAFEYTGVDYAGPIPLKLTRNTSTKA